MKLVNIFSVNPHLGPLQISLGRMIIDIIKFFFIYTLVLFAFGCGMFYFITLITMYFYKPKYKYICKSIYFCDINLKTSRIGKSLFSISGNRCKKSITHTSILLLLPQINTNPLNDCKTCRY